MIVEIILRDIHADDVRVFYEHQLDDEANHMAAFTKKDPSDWNSFNQHWINVMSNSDVEVQTIIYNNTIAGYVAMYLIQEEKNIGYWIDQKFWGKGIATEALKKFLSIIPIRPLFARVAFDNIASIKVLEKCNFSKTGEDQYFANSRGEEIIEFIFQLND